MPFHAMHLNALLASSASGAAHAPPALIEWDTRHAPHRAARVAGQPISAHYLSQPAIYPNVTSVHIVSDLLSADWDVTVHNPSGVTIEDVLATIHNKLHAPLTHAEWERMTPSQRSRIETVFYARCEASRNFEHTRHGGVRRMDSLLHSTMFAGLSSLVIRNNRWEVVLTLSRDFGAHVRPRT